MKRYEIGVWIVVAAYLLLAAIWAFHPTAFPHPPIHKEDAQQVVRHQDWELEQLSVSPAQENVYFAVLFCVFGLLQTRALGGRCVPFLTAAFVILAGCSAAEIWFLSIH